ncbi:hypothetical protein [Haloarchaeobius sp. DYHT-AS-18]|uniref:hypothetical protein n=1 Tax=Haloarchaeobius sp. DYHT-AS-18 TaxID=3446117 RepID=UPI003EBDD49D
MTYKNSTLTQGELGADPRDLVNTEAVDEVVTDTLREGPADDDVSLEDILAAAEAAARGTLTDHEFRQLVDEVVDDILDETDDLSSDCHHTLDQFAAPDHGGEEETA